MLRVAWNIFLFCIASVGICIYFGSKYKSNMQPTELNQITVDERLSVNLNKESRIQGNISESTAPVLYSNKNEINIQQTTQPDTAIDDRKYYTNIFSLEESNFAEMEQNSSEPIQAQHTATSMRISAKASKKFNVLFIVSDDLRPQLSTYRGPHYPNPHSPVRMHTPNLDSLAEKSLLLTRAYAQYALCAPSRTSFLTGRRPDTTKVWDLVTYWRESAGEFTTLPQFFKDNGYTTVATGKIFHGGKSAHHFDAPSWSIKYKRPKHGTYWNYHKVKDSWRAVKKTERVDCPLPDEEILAQAQEHLNNFAPAALAGETNFFLGVGFHKPHLPFVFPEEYLDLYPLDKLDIPENYFSPYKLPQAAFHPPHELTICEDIKQINISGTMNETLPDITTKLLRRAYFSCVSYIDHLVGDLLITLRNLGLEESTLVSFIGDHGWHLGENGEWGKHTNFEQGVHTPMMIHIPGRTDHGIRSDSVVELLDLFPTLVEAAGFGKVPECPLDSSNIKLCTEGVSILPLVDDPLMQARGMAYSQMMRKGIMGYSVRTDRYRYTEWVPLERLEGQTGRNTYDILWKSHHGIELYDHVLDPVENINIAGSREAADMQLMLRCNLQKHIGTRIFNATITI